MLTTIWQFFSSSFCFIPLLFHFNIAHRILQLSNTFHLPKKITSITACCIEKDLQCYKHCHTLTLTLSDRKPLSLLIRQIVKTFRDISYLTNCIFCLPLLIYNFLQPYFTALSCLILPTKSSSRERIQIPLARISLACLQVFFGAMPAQSSRDSRRAPPCRLPRTLCNTRWRCRSAQAQCCYFKCLLQVAVAAEAAQLAVEFQIALPVDLVLWCIDSFDLLALHRLIFPAQTDFPPSGTGKLAAGAPSSITFRYSTTSLICCGVIATT